MRVFLTTFLAIALSACSSMADQASRSLNAAGLEGTRWGLVVMTMEGRELIAIRPDERFTPASNTKIFTVAAAFHRLGDMTKADPSMGTSVRVVPNADGPPDIELVGGGDAMLLDSADCERNCLSQLADTVIAGGIESVATVVADERLYPRELIPPGWSHEDIITRSGAPVSALTVNSNEVTLVIQPGAVAGDTATVRWRDPPALFTLQDDVLTVDAETFLDDVYVERRPGSGTVNVYGLVKAGGAEIALPVAVEDPAFSAAMRFNALLQARGVHTSGNIQTFHELRLIEGQAPPTELPRGAVEIARLLPPPLIEDITLLMKQSQNLHAELLLRRVGLVDGDGSRQAGLEAVETMLAEIGVPRWTWDLSDGSGMSIYNRVTPRTVAKLLLWTTRQAWAEQFRSTFPVGGVDGTLRRRFAGTSLEGRVFAKTGTLTGVNALSGFMLTKSGKTLIFSAYANDRPSVAGSATAAMDAALVQISETN